MAIGERIRRIRNMRGMILKYLGVMHTLFALEDTFGLRIDKLSDEVCIRLDKDNGTEYLTMLKMFNEWQEKAGQLRNGEITKEEYDNWRYNFKR